MPTLIHPLKDAYVAITRRIVMQYTRRLLLHLDIPANIDIIYRGESTQITTWNSTTKKAEKVERDPTGALRFDKAKHRLVVEIREDTLDDAYATMGLYTNEYPAIWYHPGHGTTIRPVYVRKKLTMSYQFVTTNMEVADKWMANLQSLLGQDGGTFLTDIQYLIVPDDDVIDIMTNVHCLQEAVEPYGISFDDWMKTYADGASGKNILMNAAKRGWNYAFGERQVRCLSQLELTQVPDRSKRDDSPGYEITFDSTLYYDKVISTATKFPITVHNQMMPEKYIPQVKIDDPRKHQGYRYTTLMKNSFGMYDPVNLQEDYTKNTGVVIPLGDDWTPNRRYGEYVPVFTGLVPISSYDEEGWMLVGSLDTFEEYLYLSPGLKRYISDRPEVIFDYRRSPITVVLYCNDSLIDSTNLKMDDEGNIYTNFKLSKRDQLHILLTVPHDYIKHDKHFFKTLAYYPDLVEDIYDFWVKDDRQPTMDILADIKVSYNKEGVVQGIPFDQYYKQQVENRVIHNRRVKKTKLGWWDKVRRGLLLNQTASYPHAKIINQIFANWLNSKSISLDEFTNSQRLDDRINVVEAFCQPLYESLKKLDVPMGEFDSDYFGICDTLNLQRDLSVRGLTRYPTLDWYRGGSMRTVMKSFIRAKDHVDN